MLLCCSGKYVLAGPGVLSELKTRAQHYRERLSVYEAPIPADDRFDRRARARDWLRSSSARRRSGGVGLGSGAPGREERDREERGAEAAQAAVARATWVLDDQEPARDTSVASQGGSVKGGASVDGADAPALEEEEGGGGGGASSTPSKRPPATPSSCDGCGEEGGETSPVGAARQFTPPPSTPSNKSVGDAGGGAGSEGGKIGEECADGSRSVGTTSPGDSRPSPSVGDDQLTRDGGSGGGDVSQSERQASGAGAAGEGVAAAAAAAAEPKHPNVDQKELFLPNLVMEFGEDSPAFRRKVETLDSNVEGLRGQLQQLVAVARKYCGNGLAFCEHGRELAGVLMNPRGESWFTRLGALAPALEELGRVLGDIQGFQEDILLRPLENAFYPMEDFVKGEVKTIRKVRILVYYR
ncbi:conserved unknown protein [Ectocarpus siliculosus]|uniref:Uncharacterized protein n=1 Tax=Ectocarpus siliculosus TaxID=2880 RepID=D7G5U9_ECTSI|nr:conserved unknown protein [Ectocarpus siliculosus]|eukprot:CBJ33893.1 conserved unknown protein [Ectocarpus siliculosus]